MSSVTFREDPAHFATPIPDSFILDKMPSANGVYVKVYLYVFHCYYHRKQDFTFADTAKVLNILESEVMEALRHWNAQGALRLLYNKASDAYCISFAEIDGSGATPPGNGHPAGKAKNTTPSKVIRVEQAPSYSQEEMSLYQKNPEISGLFSAVSHLLGTQLSLSSMSRIFSFYDYYRLPVDVIVYMVEYCVERDKRDLRYIEKVAMNWSDNNIHSIEDAEAYVHRFDRYMPILKALRSSSTIPTDDQARYIDQWTDEYGMDLEVLIEAAARTFERTHRAQFSYMKTIIEAWHEKGITTMQGVLAEDAVFNAKGNIPASNMQRGSYKDNRYIPSNEYNYEEILAQHRKRLYDQYDQPKEN